MLRLGRSALMAGLMASVLVLPGCKKEDARIKEMTEKAAQADTAQQQKAQMDEEQAKRLKQAGVSANPETLQLTDEQKKVLEDRIKSEKDSSYRALLQETIDKDKQIKELDSKLAKLKSELPKPDVARPGDSHYGLALRFLKKQGVPEAQAKRMVENVNIMDKLAPGFEVYHFYSNGTYGTWVAKGHAKISPSELNRQERAKIEGERDTALAENEKLQEEVTDLDSQKKQLEGDIEGLRQEKAQVIEDITKLRGENESLTSNVNSLHYIVGKRDELKTKGIIIIPVFAKDRMGPGVKDSQFDKALDLRTSDSIEISAAELGLKKIGKVNVVPGSLVKDQHYSLAISADKMSATVKILDKERLKNEKVVFAVTD